MNLRCIFSLFRMSQRVVARMSEVPATVTLESSSEISWKGVTSTVHTTRILGLHAAEGGEKQHGYRHVSGERGPRRTRPAGAGPDLRGDPVSHRAARPARRERQAPRPPPAPRHPLARPSD